MDNSITDVPGIKVGHYTDRVAATGCTVILCETGATGGVDIRGSASGTRETNALHPMSMVEQIHAIVLSGGSAFGLDTAGGVMRYLEERGIGFDVGVTKVPIVPTAILFDLRIGNAKVRPGIEEGYQACLAAGIEVSEGCVGAGTGATVGKIQGMERATKGGLGTASEKIADDIIIAAIVAVNAFGDVVHPKTGEILAGSRHPEGKGFLSTSELLKNGEMLHAPFDNTTIGVIATNACLTKDQANKLAQMAHDGIARSIIPCHTMVDGDVVFAISLGEKKADVTMLGTTAADVIASAIMRAVLQAETLAGIPAVKEVV